MYSSVSMNKCSYVNNIQPLFKQTRVAVYSMEFVNILMSQKVHNVNCDCLQQRTVLSRKTLVLFCCLQY